MRISPELRMTPAPAHDSKQLSASGPYYEQVVCISWCEGKAWRLNQLYSFYVHHQMHRGLDRKLASQMCSQACKKTVKHAHLKGEVQAFAVASYPDKCHCASPGGTQSDVHIRETGNSQKWKNSVHTWKQVIMRTVTPCASTQATS